MEWRPQTKKGLRRKLKSFFPEIRWRPKRKKERSSPQFVTIFGKIFVWSFSPGWLFFLWFSSAQLSVRGRLNFDGGTLTLDGGKRPPYNLSTAHTLLPLAAGGFAPRPPLASDGWGLRPQTPKTAPHCEFLATRLTAVRKDDRGSWNWKDKACLSHFYH